MKIPLKSKAKIYRDAAEELLKLPITGCCFVLKMERASDLEKRFFKWLFKPKTYFMYWWGWPEEGEPLEARILALLLAAEIVERGEL